VREQGRRYVRFEGYPATERMYGCVRCQAWHRETDGPIFRDHLMAQSKQGISRVAVENTYDEAYLGQTTTPPIEARRVNVQAEAEAEAER
jgi:hypothetical protein